MKKMNKLVKGCMVLASAAMLTSCSDSFLEQDPLSFYNPGNTYVTESGLRSAMAMFSGGWMPGPRFSLNTDRPKKHGFPWMHRGI